MGALDLLGIPILLMGSPPNLSIIIIGNPGFQNDKDLLGVPILLMGFKHIGNPDKDLLGVPILLMGFKHIGNLGSPKL